MLDFQQERVQIWTIVFLRAGEIDRSEDRFWRNWGEDSCPERSCNLQSELPTWLVGCANLLVHVTMPLYTLQCEYEKWTLFTLTFIFIRIFRGFGFLARPNFFFLESVSHFGIMHACKCNDDWSSTTVDNKKNASACLCWKSNKQMRSKPQAQVDKGPIIYLVGSAWVVEYKLVSWC